MLGKLLKYELRATGRIMLPLYLAVIAVGAVFAAIIRLSMSDAAKAFLDAFAVISGFVFALVLTAVVVVMAILVIQRFYKNLLGNEGYLMFTLPVTTLDHILSKWISSLIWILGGIIAGGATGLIMISITSDLGEFYGELTQLWNTFITQATAAKIAMFVVMLILSIADSIMKVYAAIAVGHQWGNHRLAGAVLAYIGIGVIEMLLIACPPVSRMMSKVDNAMNSFSMGGFGVLYAISIISILIYGGLTWYLLDRRLNLE